MGLITNPEDEAQRIFDVLIEVMPENVDGREAIIQMKEEGSRNWRQMEWIGFWFEHLVDRNVRPALGGRCGPTYGRVTFDLQLANIWDLKVHPEEAGTQAILNDREATDAVVEQFGGLGFIVIFGNAKYDDEEGSFKAWHNIYKGGRSSYERARIRRGAPSRRRKVSFSPNRASAIWFETNLEFIQAMQEGWMKEFQKGMRNSNGVARRGKYQIDLSKVPTKHLIAEAEF